VASPSTGGLDPRDRRLAWGLFFFVLLIFGTDAALQYRPLSFLIGDCPYYASTSVSLLFDGDLDLRNQLLGGLKVHGRQIALGENAAWYPKHPILMPVVALPFLWAFGMPGFLLFNLVVLALLAVGLMKLARSVASPPAAAIGALLMVTGTFLRHYGYNFSPDVFATGVLVAALLATIRGMDARGGLLAGLAVVAKLTHLFLVPLFLGYSILARGWRAGARAAACAALPLLALAALNLVLFGSPFETSYDRNVAVEADGIATLSHRGLFDGDPLGGLAAELFDLRHGLLTTSPILFLALPGFFLLFRRRPLDAALYLLIGEFLLLFFGTYRYWMTSHYGNRFLIPVVAICVPAISLSLDWLWRRLGSRWSRPRRAPAHAPPSP
jgi:hypothetical protein